MSENPRQPRRPGGTPAGGQFAPTHRPEAGHVELEDDVVNDVVDDADTAPSRSIPTRQVTLHSSTLEDVVIEIEEALEDDSRDSDESVYWTSQRWASHLEHLLGHAYEQVSVAYDDDADTYKMQLAQPRGSVLAREITASLRGLGPVPTPVSRHTNPDGSFGGLVATSAHVGREAWVGPQARVLGRAKVLGTAKVLDEAIVSDDALVAGNAVVRDRARVLDHAIVADGALVSDDALVTASAAVLERARVVELAIVSGEAIVRDHAIVSGRSVVCGQSSLDDCAETRDRAYVAGEAVISGRAVLAGERVLAGCEVA